MQVRTYGRLQNLNFFGVDLKYSSNKIRKAQNYLNIVFQNFEQSVIVNFMLNS